MLTPEGGGETPENFTHPEGLRDTIGQAVGHYEIDIEVNYDEDWKSTAIIERLSRNLAQKRKALEVLLEKHGDVPLLFTVLEAPDRLMHCHYKYIDPRCEHFDRPEAAPIRERVGVLRRDGRGHRRSHRVGGPRRLRHNDVRPRLRAQGQSGQRQPRFEGVGPA